MGCPSPCSPHPGFTQVFTFTIYIYFFFVYSYIFFSSAAPANPVILHLSIPRFLMHRCVGYTNKHKFTVQGGKGKILPFKFCLSETRGFIQSWGGFSCQRQGPVWVFIYLFYESRQGNHISYGCTVTIGLLYRVLSLSLSLSLSLECCPISLSASVSKTNQTPLF